MILQDEVNIQEFRRGALIKNAIIQCRLYFAQELLL